MTSAFRGVASVTPAALLMLLLALAALPRPVQAQSGSLDIPIDLSTSLRADDQVAVQVLGGVLGGIAGFFIGGYTGVALEKGTGNCSGVEWCGFSGAILGTAIGETLGVPIGVHLASSTPGSLVRPMLYSVGAAAAGLLLAGPTAGGSLLAVPPAQIYLSIRTR